MIKISLIIPCFNAQLFLQECLESVFRDDFIGQCEVIAIDDGSSDNTAEILREFALEHENLKIISQKNSGASVARNAGLKIAKGEFVAFLDSDDELCAGSLEALYKKAKECDAQIVIGDFFVLNEKEKIRQKSYDFSANSSLLDKDEFFEYFCTKGTHFAIWAKLYRKNLLDDLSFLEGVFVSEDVLFNTLAFKKAKNIAKCDIAVVCYRVGQNNSSKVFKEKHFKDSLKVAENLEALSDDICVSALILRLKYEAMLSIKSAPDYLSKGIFKAIFNKGFKLLDKKLKLQIILRAFLGKSLYFLSLNLLKKLLKKAKF